MASSSSVIESTVPQAEDEWIRQSNGFYACPICKQGLQPVDDGLSCRACARTYPIRSGIPDFIVVNLEESRNLTLHMLGKKDSRTLLNFAVSVYETWVYPAVCNVYGGWHSTSLKQLAHDITEIIGSQNGLVLDVACGPGTYGRRIASASKTVLGIDACMSMLPAGRPLCRKGTYSQRALRPRYGGGAAVPGWPVRHRHLCRIAEPLLRHGPRFARDQPHHESRSAAGGNVLLRRQQGPHPTQIYSRACGERRRSYLRTS